MPNLEKDWSKAVEYASSTASGDDESGSRTGSVSGSKNMSLSDDTSLVGEVFAINVDEEQLDKNSKK